MYAQREHSPCERSVKKPLHLTKKKAHEVDRVQLEEEIEAYRDKIQISDAIHEIEKQEEEETRQGANDLVKNLQQELDALRLKLRDALNMEKTVVQKALKMHRDLQLAMDGCDANGTLCWLDDRWFDQRKKLDFILSHIYEKRLLLAESEDLVATIEKFPRPGALPWEQEVISNINALRVAIESMKARKETVAILLQKYLEIKETLTRESGGYEKMLTDSRNEMDYQRSELERMQRALKISENYLAMAKDELSIAEKEGNKGRKDRIEIMNTKKAAIEERKSKYDDQEASRKHFRIAFDPSEMTNPMDELQEIRDRITEKHQDLLNYRLMASRLTETVHVGSIEEVPYRFVHEIQLWSRLYDERTMKNELLHVLSRQKDQLCRILYHFKNTGDTKLQKFKEKLSEFKSQIDAAKRKRDELQQKAKQRECASAQAKFGAIGLLRRIRDCYPLKKNLKQIGMPNTRLSLEMFGDLCAREGQALQTLHNEEKRSVDHINTDSDNVHIVEDKPTIDYRLIRVQVASPELKDEEESFSIEAGSNVPERLDIKEENFRFKQHKEMQQFCK